MGFHVSDGALRLAAEADLGPLKAALVRLRRIAESAGHSGEAEFFPLPSSSAGGGGGRAAGSFPLLVGVMSCQHCMRNYFYVDTITFDLELCAAAARPQMRRQCRSSILACVKATTLCNAFARPVPALLQGTPGYRYQETIHYSSSCDCGINDGSERLFTGLHTAPRGEFRCDLL